MSQWSPLVRWLISCELIKAMKHLNYEWLYGAVWALWELWALRANKVSDMPTNDFLIDGFVRRRPYDCFFDLIKILFQLASSKIKIQHCMQLTKRGWNKYSKHTDNNYLSIDFYRWLTKKLQICCNIFKCRKISKKAI